MKDRSINLKVSNITPKQWTNLVIELNLIRQAWKPFATIEIQAPGIKKILSQGAKTHDKED